MKKISILLIVGVFLLSSLALIADDMETAKAMVGKAAQFFKDNGKEAAIKELSNPEGQFIKNSFYVFAYDLEGAIVAHPYKHDLIGKNLLEKTDSKGNFFRKEINRIAKEKGSGWVDYYYMNPKTKKEELKTTYFEKVGDIIICCGVYKNK